jgi:hypothetical protein
MTVPFRDPIIYPGAPMPDPLPGRWGYLQDPVTCHNGEPLIPGVLARWTRGRWECRAHALTETP